MVDVIQNVYKKKKKKKQGINKITSGRVGIMLDKESIYSLEMTVFTFQIRKIIRCDLLEVLNETICVLQKGD